MSRGEGYLRKRGNVWYFEFMYHGKRYYHRIGAVSKSVAKEIAGQIRTQIVRGEYIPPKEHGITFRQLAQAYEEWYIANSQAQPYAKEIHIQRIRILVKFFGDIPAHRISSFTIEQYKRYRTENSDAKPVTVDKELAILRSVFRKSKELGIYSGDIPVIPFYKAQTKEITRFLTPEEAQKLLAVCPVHLKRIVIFALNTGCRAGEIINLKWDQVDFKAGVIHIQSEATKSKKKYTIIMNSTVRKLLEEIKNQNTSCEYVFTSSRGEPYKRNGYRKAFKQALKNAGLQDFRFHDLRHTFASWVALKSKDIYLVKELLNHGSVEITKRYAHLTEEYKIKTLEEISEIFRQQEEGSVQNTG